LKLVPTPALTHARAGTNLLELTCSGKVRNHFVLSDSYCEKDLIHLKLNGFPPFLFRAGHIGCVRHQMIEFVGSRRYCNLLPDFDQWYQDGDTNWAWIRL
jgi:hypothetical protein